MTIKNNFGDYVKTIEEITKVIEKRRKNEPNHWNNNFIKEEMP